MKKYAWVRFVWPLFFVMSALVIKYVYLHTAESAVDIEELPLIPLNAVMRGAGHVDIGDTRLYGINYITNYIFLSVFGFNITALKLTSLAFFFAACVATYEIARAWFPEKNAWLKYLPVALLTFGPPVAQMWSLKNRGGFIETIAFFAISVWLYQRWLKWPSKIDYVYAMGVVCGFAMWSQPIAIVFILPLMLGLAWEGFREGWRRSVTCTMRFSFSCLVGVMPLVALNFIYNFNTFRVIAGGEGGQGAATPLGRFGRLFSQGIPRIVGLKQQWSEHWLLGSLVSVTLLVILLAILTFSLFVIMKRFAKDKKFDEKVVLFSSLALILAANVLASWGSFQEEPRRLLLLYVPLTLLVVAGLANWPKLLMSFCVLWFGISAISNVQYVRANQAGFVSPFYVSYKEVADFLLDHDINHVYVNVWEGAKISFESHMRITWSATPYMLSGNGFRTDGRFSFHDAAVFYLRQPGARAAADRMMGDLKIAGISCVEGSSASFLVIYACSREFNVFRLPREAGQVRDFKKQGVVFDWATYSSGSFDNIYAKEASMVWTRPDVTLPVRIDVKKGESLCITTGTQRKITPESLHVTIGKTAIRLQIENADESHSAFASAPLPDLDAATEIEVSVDPMVPARLGSRDSRVLGLPLHTVRFVKSADMCQ